MNIFKKYVSPRVDIPKNIIQLGEPIHFEKCKEYVESVRTHTSGFNHITFSNQEMEDFLSTEYPELYKVYLKLPILIQKIDFFRYIAVYHYGGIYLDLDVEMIRPFSEDFFKNSSVFPLDTFVHSQLIPEERFKNFIECGQRFIIGQYAFAAVKKDSFIQSLIDGIADNINNIVNSYENTRLYVYRTTGPDYVTMRYMEYKFKHEVTVLFTLSEQKFGDYAIHHYMGSWKKNIPNTSRGW